MDGRRDRLSFKTLVCSQPTTCGSRGWRTCRLSSRNDPFRHPTVPQPHKKRGEVLSHVRTSAFSSSNTPRWVRITQKLKVPFPCHTTTQSSLPSIIQAPSPSRLFQSYNNPHPKHRCCMFPSPSTLLRTPLLFTEPKGGRRTSTQ